MPALRERKTIAGLFLIGIPLVVVAAAVMNSFRGCTNCAADQLWLLIPTTHPISTIIFGSLITGGGLLVFGLRSVKIPLNRTKLFLTGIGFVSVAAIFLVWSVVEYSEYLDMQKHQSTCYGCPPSIYTPPYGVFAIIGGFFSCIGAISLLMNWKRKVLHAHGYI